MGLLGFPAGSQAGLLYGRGGQFSVFDTLYIGGLETTLRPAHVLLKENSSNGQWYHGNLGLDFLNQADTVTLDFVAMSLTLE